MKITRYGQSALLVREGETRLLIDPGELSGDEVFLLEGLTAVAFTHEHPDHCAPDRVLQLLLKNPDALVLGGRAVIEQLAMTSDRRARALSDADVVELPELQIRVHAGGHQLIHASVPVIENLGFMVTDPSGTRLFHPGDSYQVAPSDVDVLALPIVGPWGSLREAVSFADTVMPRRMFPIHDVHLSGSGRALFWPWIQKFSCDDIEGFDPAPEREFDLGRR